MEADYVASSYPPPPQTIYPPHQIATILEESEILLWRFRITYNNIHVVSLLHGIVYNLHLRRVIVSLRAQHGQM